MSAEDAYLEEGSAHLLDELVHTNSGSLLDCGIDSTLLGLELEGIHVRDFRGKVENTFSVDFSVFVSAQHDTAQRSLSTLRGQLGALRTLADVNALGYSPSFRRRQSSCGIPQSQPCR